MTRVRYSQWMAVWEWFVSQKRSSESEPLYALYNMLNEMWQQDRESNTATQLAEYARSLQPRLEDDPEFKKFLQDLDKGFSKEP